MVKPRKIADWVEDDFGWSWLIEAWTIAYQNVCYVTGVIDDPQQIEGIVEETQELEGHIGCWS